MHAAFLSVASPAVPVRYLVASIAAHGLLAATPMSAPETTLAGVTQSLRVELRQAPRPLAEVPATEAGPTPARTIRAMPAIAESPRPATVATPLPASTALPPAAAAEIAASPPPAATPAPPEPMQLARAAPTAIDLPPLRSGPSDFHLLALYTQQLGSAVNQQRRYPPLARVRGWQGTTILDLGVGPAGEVVSLSVASSSGFELLDEQAMAMVRAAQPLPPPAVDPESSPLLVQLPITFSLR